MQPVDQFIITRRNLPHWQQPGSVYFVTWRTVDGVELTSNDRTVTMEALKFWDGKRWVVYAAVVMPDHVHVLARPLPHSGDASLTDQPFHDLGVLVGSAKKFSARRINQSRQSRGTVWQDERYDRIVRDDREFEEMWLYIHNNPVAAGLVGAAEEYP